MALTGHVFPNPPPSEYACVQVVSVSVSRARLISLLRMGSSFSVIRGTNTYYDIVEISFLMHHQVPYNLAKNK
jgi:hypothetical protein